MLEPFGGVARHGEETPAQLAGVEIPRAHVATRVEFRAAISDHYDLPCDLRRAGDGVTPLLVDEGVHLPQQSTVRGIERDQAPVERADVHLAPPHSHTPIHGVTTRFSQCLAVYLRIESPKLLACARIQREYAAKFARCIDDAVDYDRRGFESAPGCSLVLPGEPQPFHTVAIDLLERRVVAHAHVVPSGEPLR